MGASVATLAMFTFIAIIGALNLAFGLPGANEPQMLFGIALLLLGVIADVIAAVSGHRG
jgi:hypothetical protein